MTRHTTQLPDLLVRLHLVPPPSSIFVVSSRTKHCCNDLPKPLSPSSLVARELGNISPKCSFLLFQRRSFLQFVNPSSSHRNPSHSFSHPTPPRLSRRQPSLMILSTTPLISPRQQHLPPFHSRSLLRKRSLLPLLLLLLFLNPLLNTRHIHIPRCGCFLKKKRRGINTM